MAKFYVESGNFRETINNDNYMEAIIVVLKKLAKEQMSGKKKDIRLGPTISVSEMGFVSKIDENIPIDELTERKKKYISVKKLTDDIVYEVGLTLFLPIKPIIDMLEI
jgi:hypothetical protein